MPKFYVYARVSHQDQEDGDSVPAQKQRGHHYWEDHFQDNGIEWGGMFEEPGHRSASAVPFMRRKAGKEAIQKLQAGDVLYVDKVDRLWRNIHDFSDLLRWFDNHQVQLVFGNLLGATFSMHSPLGEFMLPLMVLVAQLESRQTSDRIKADFAYQKENGFFPHRKECAPLGTKAITAIPYVPTKTKKPKKMLAWDMPTRLIMAEIVKLRDIDQLGWEDISFRIALKVDGHIPAYQTNQFWHWARCVHAYALEKEYALIQEPRYMPFKSLPTMFAAIQKYAPHERPQSRAPQTKRHRSLARFARSGH